MAAGLVIHLDPVRLRPSRLQQHGSFCGEGSGGVQ